MIRALNTAATGMASQDANVSTIANNIANVNTNAFKASRAEFDDLLYETVQEAGAKSSPDTSYSVGTQIGSGSKVSAIKKQFSQGLPNITNNPYDLMVNGEGFFGVVGMDGNVSFTRDGSFTVDSTGALVTKSGEKLFPGFTIPQKTHHVNIDAAGGIEAFIDGQTEPVKLGQIPLFQFQNPEGLKSLGGNKYHATIGSGVATQSIAATNGSGQIQQGAIELSNVNVMQEMTNLIKAQRAYEMNSKVMSAADQMLQVVNNVK